MVFWRLAIDGKEREYDQQFQLFAETSTQVSEQQTRAGRCYLRQKIMMIRTCSRSRSRFAESHKRSSDKTGRAEITNLSSLVHVRFTEVYTGVCEHTSNLFVPLAIGVKEVFYPAQSNFLECDENGKPISSCRKNVFRIVKGCVFEHLLPAGYN